MAKKRFFFFLERNSKVLYLSSESLSCLPVLIRAELSRRSRATLRRNAQKSVMHVQSCCFANQKPLAFLTFALPLLTWLLKLTGVKLKKRMVSCAVQVWLFTQSLFEEVGFPT